MLNKLSIAFAHYCKAAREYKSNDVFAEVFEAMYADDADDLEAAMESYKKNRNLTRLRNSVHILADDGCDLFLAFLLKHGYTEVHDALK